MSIMVENKYQLTLCKSVGPIRLGTARSSIIQELGEPENTRRGKYAIRDDYLDSGISIEYRITDEVCANISVGPPAQLIHEGKDLLMMTWVEGVRWLGRRDPEAEAEGEGWESKKLGIDIYPKVEEDGSFRRVDLVNVFDRSYFPPEDEIDAEVQRMIDATPSEEEIAKRLWGEFD
jgi:hypothetical protein